MKKLKTLLNNLNKPWLIFLGFFLTAFIGTVVWPDGLIEWPFVPVVFFSIIPAWVGVSKDKEKPDWWRFAAMFVGALLMQILYWIA